MNRLVHHCPFYFIKSDWKIELSHFPQKKFEHFQKELFLSLPPPLTFHSKQWNTQGRGLRLPLLRPSLLCEGWWTPRAQLRKPEGGSELCPQHHLVPSRGPPGRLLWSCVMVLLPAPWLIALTAAKSHQSCPTLCDPIDGSPPGSPVPGILQARTLEWAAISFSNAWKWKGKVSPTLSNPMDRSLPSSSVLGIFQARVLEWVTIAFPHCPN